MGYSPRGCKESDMTEHTCYAYIQQFTSANPKLPIHPSLTLLPLGNHDSVLYGLDPIFKQLCNTPYLHTQCVTRFLKVKACPNQALDREEGSVVQENVLRTTLQKMYC